MEMRTASATQTRGVCSFEKTSANPVERFVPTK